MGRWFVAAMAGLLVQGVFRLYCFFMLPVLAMHGDAVPPPLPGATEFNPPVFRKAAEEHLADFPWTQNAAVKWQRGENIFLFAESAEPESNGDGNTVRLEPLAMLWKDPRNPDAPPYRLVASKGRMQFENSFFQGGFDLAGADPGRIVWGSLEGEVLISGPDGLEVRGRDFVFSEDSAELYSYYPVTFAYGPTGERQTAIRGSADQLNLRFVAASTPVLGKDLPRVSGLESLKLRQNVQLQIAYIQSGKPVQANVSSKGPFEYEFQKQSASFEQDVRVNQQQQLSDAREVYDRLVCEWLGLAFEKDPQLTEAQEESDEPEFESPELDKLRLRRVRAVGRQGRGTQAISKVIVESQAQGILGNMHDLTYDAIERVAVLQDPQEVIVQRGQTRFSGPHIRVEHGAHQELVSLDCNGAGKLVHEDPRFASGPVEASWNQSVTLRPTPDGSQQVVTLRGGTKMLIPETFGLAADVTTLWLDPEQLRDLEGNQVNMMQRPLPLQKAEATGHVKVLGPDLVVRRSDRITAVINPGRVAGKSGGILQTGGQNSESRAEQSRSAEPMYVESDELHIALVHDAMFGRIDVREITGDGAVRIEHHSPQTIEVAGHPTEQHLTISGTGFTATNTQAGDQTVTLKGVVAPNGDITRPALLELGHLKFGGGQLTLDRRNNVITVDGPGLLGFPLPADKSSERPSEPTLMEIKWRERMTFDGLEAQFFGGVQASVENHAESISRLECEDLWVRLNQRVQFDTNKSPSEVQLKTLKCRHNVRIDAYSYTGTSLTGRRHAELAEFTVNHDSGEFVGLGPGMVDDWTFGSSVRLSPQDSPKANRPVQPKQATWRYTHLTFRGKITGHIQQEWAELSDRVEVVSAPVEKPSQTFHRHDLSAQTNQAANAVWMGCERLRIRYPTETKTIKRTLEMLAYDSTELEGQVFHATADEIAFDEQNGRFILRGHGRDARLHFQEAPGAPVNTTENRLVEFIPSKPSITLDGSTGLNGGL